MPARTLMVQGTASSVGKSLLVTALCRLFAREGFRVAPFKAQNMALNSFVTPDGGEIGRAQAVQAEAAGIVPTVDVNPVLLKPEGDGHCQVVVLGKPIARMSAAEYHARKPELRRIVGECLERLRSRHDLVVIEGAGSPAEVNLKDRDIVNMSVARAADAPVLLVGDIDRGGVFAAFVGTLELLEPDERSRIAAFVVNRFRGDVALLEPGLEFLERRTGVPVLGVLPYIAALRIAEEDSVALEERARRPRGGRNALDVAVVRFPRISNYDDFDPLEHEAGVAVRFVETEEEAHGADLLILPGTKCTAADLAWLRERGLARVVEERARSGEPVLGICGGFQMLGERIEDPFGVESREPRVPGLGLFAIRTVFERTKVAAQVRARVRSPSFLADDRARGGEVSGYEIHMGSVERLGDTPAPFEIVARNGTATRLADGAIGAGGAVVGTLIHGLFENDAVRRSLLRALRKRRGLLDAGSGRIPSREAEYDRLADFAAEHLDVALLRRIIGLDGEKRRRLDPGVA